MGTAVEYTTIICPRCGGTGSIYYKDYRYPYDVFVHSVCPVCFGKGEIDIREPLRLATKGEVNELYS